MTATISKYICNANVLMTFLIIALHTIGDDIRFRSIRWFVDFSVPTFFTISSYLYFQKFELTLSCYVKKIVSRFYSLYIPFVIFSAIFIPYIYVKTYILGIPNERGVSMDFLSLTGSILLGYPEVLNGPLWFVKALFLFSFFAPAIGYCVKKNRLLGFLVFISGFLLTFYTNYFQVFYWIPCFTLGCYAAFYENDLLHIVNKIYQCKHIRLYTALLFLLYFILSYYLIHDKPYESFLYYCHRIAAPLWVIIIYAIYQGILSDSLVHKLYPYTFFVYCTHTFFIYFSERVITLLAPLLDVFTTKLLVFVSASLMVFLLAFTVSYIRPLWRILNGFRVRK